MQLYTARAKLTLPGGDWFAQAVAAHRELVAMPLEKHGVGRGAELCYLLDNMDGVTLSGLDGDVIDDLNISFAYYNEATGVLVLLVNHNEDADEIEPVPFDRLFTYDPKVMKFWICDRGYIIARVADGKLLSDHVTVVQPEPGDSPCDACAATPPTKFIEQLLTFVAV